MPKSKGEFIMAKTTAQKITEAKAEIQQRENELKLLTQKFKAEEQKKRTHRLCERGGLLESLLPDTIPLTKEKFKLLLEMTIVSKDGKAFLAELIAEQEKQTAVVDAVADPQDGGKRADTPPNPTALSNPTPAAKPANPAQGGGVNANAKTANNSNIAASALNANSDKPSKQAS
jgi:hypothetical protein